MIKSKDLRSLRRAQVWGERAKSILPYMCELCDDAEDWTHAVETYACAAAHYANRLLRREQNRNLRVIR